MESYLGVTAYAQNEGAKPQGQSRRECSQGGAAMTRREEASFLDLAGRHMSRNDGRVSLSWTKPSRALAPSSWRTTNAVRSPGGTARPACMPGKRSVSFTDEVPRGSSLGSISCVYKALPKGSSYAPAAGTATPWPRPQGCLQRQSTPSALEGGKAKPQSASSASASSWDKLASAKKRSRTPGPPLRTVPPRGEKCLPRRPGLPILGIQLCPSQEPHAPACSRGRPVREIRSPVQYEELTSLRQRGGGGFGLPLTQRRSTWAHWSFMVPMRGNKAVEVLQKGSCFDLGSPSKIGQCAPGSFQRWNYCPSQSPFDKRPQFSVVVWRSCRQ
jgi:hypothetical protein